MLWHGKEPSSQPPANCLFENMEYSFNSARYGPCIASTFRTLEMTVSSGIRYAGEAFDVRVAKLDFYNQIIQSDSSSVIELFSTKPNLANFNGGEASLLQGEAALQVALLPVFPTQDPTNHQESFAHTIFARGPDLLGDGTMTSPTRNIQLQTGMDMCREGSLLFTTATASGSFQGVCTRCEAGTYTINPAISECVTCPLDGQCSGGRDVTFQQGTWESSTGYWRRTDCPEGHVLIRTEDSPSDDRCYACPGQCNPIR
eukprot:3667417-Rhodomonas_salina.1